MEMRVMGKKSNALGRGLGTIIQDHSANIENVISQGENGQGLSIMKIPLDLIDPNPFQPRHNFNEEEIGELAQTIKEHGLIQPITVRKFNGRYQIVSGERRTRAARVAGLSTIDAYVHELLSDKNMGEWALIENIQRVDLNIVEIAQSYQQLIEKHGYTHEDLAKSVGKSRSVVTNTLRLLKLPESVQNWIQEGKLSSSAARSLLSPEITDPEQTARNIIEKGLNVRNVEQIAKDAKKEKTNPTEKKPEMSADVAAFIKKLEELFGTKVQIHSPKQDYSQGKIVIDYYSFEDLNRLSNIMERQ
jgi:ParB family chromosome partitioning protein